MPPKPAHPAIAPIAPTAPIKPIISDTPSSGVRVPACSLEGAPPVPAVVEIRMAPPRAPGFAAASAAATATAVVAPAPRVRRIALAIDADGSPRAYHPAPHARRGLDRLANAGRPGRWWGVVTDTGRADGRPVVQGPADAAPGFHVSCTALADLRFARTDPRRYVDSGAVPYVALSLAAARADGLRLGDVGFAMETPGGRSSPVILADIAPAGSDGEGSIALARALGIDPDPRTGGTASRRVSLVMFPGSGDGRPMEPARLERLARRRLAEWGGAERLMAEAGRIR